MSPCVEVPTSNDNCIELWNGRILLLVGSHARVDSNSASRVGSQQSLRVFFGNDLDYSCSCFEDNNAALILATTQRLTARTKHYLIKWHFFWSEVKNGNIVVERVDTRLQRADYMTKGLPRVLFENNRKLNQGW